MDSLQLTPQIQVTHIGPPLDKAHQPTVFYFALSGKDSVALDPYNQPALYLAKHGIRVFSLDLPAHGPNMNALDAVGVWAQEFAEGKDPISPFLDQIIFAIDALIAKGLIVREKIGVMGLSRGGLIASLIAAKYENIRAVVGFAPMTELSFASEFADLQDNENVRAINLQSHVAALCVKPIRYYIGNRDERVGTDKCFELVQNLANYAFEQNISNPPVEMIITPSVGQMGHGTSKEVFEAGADWIGRKLGTIR